MATVTSFDWRMYPGSAIQEAPGVDLRGLPRLWRPRRWRLNLPGTMNPMLRIAIATAALMAITITLLHATHHGAHAGSATHCGFWTEIEAGLSCR